MATEPALGTKIRLARERLGWTQAELAAACKVDVKTVRNWERTGKVRNRQGLIESVLGIHFDDDSNGGTGAHAPPLARTVAALAQLVADLQEQVHEDNREVSDEDNARRAAG